MMKRVCAFLLGSTALLSGQAGADLVVLQYHHISDSTPPSTSTSLSLFEGQLEAIESLEAEVVPLLEGTREALDGELKDEHKLAITFDDAYESVYTEAAPLLDRRDYPYTIFVNTDAVGKRGYMTWEQLQEVEALEHVTIANHSTDHAHLPRRPEESEEKWRERVTNSLDEAQKTLKRRLSVETPMFAYPYGEYDEALEAMLRERGWYGYGQQSGAIGKTSGATRLPRFPMANTYGQLNGLKVKLTSQALPVDADSLPAGIITRNPPELTLSLPDSLSPDRLTCFASGQGRISFNTGENGSVTVKAPEPFTSRRFRYNCTHPTGDGNYYWLSQQWVDLSRPED